MTLIECAREQSRTTTVPPNSAAHASDAVGDAGGDRPGHKAEGDGALGSLASVSKALGLLQALGDAQAPMGVSGLARATGMPKSTAFRLLSYLAESGFVERSGTAYLLGRRLFELGNHSALCRPASLSEIALPDLADLHARSGLTSQLAVLDDLDVVYVDRILGANGIRPNTHVGGRMTATATALGKVMLAFSPGAVVERAARTGMVAHTRFTVRTPQALVAQLTAARAAGVAFEREETALGLACVAAPVLVDGRAVAAVSVATTPMRIGDAQARLVRQAAASISARLAEHGVAA